MGPLSVRAGLVAALSRGTRKKGGAAAPALSVCSGGGGCLLTMASSLGIGAGLGFVGLHRPPLSIAAPAGLEKAPLLGRVGPRASV